MVEYTVIVNKEECIGCGMCENIDPDNFELGDDSKAQPKKQRLAEKEYLKAKDAAENCPVTAIILKKK